MVVGANIRCLLPVQCHQLGFTTSYCQMQELGVVLLGTKMWLSVADNNDRSWCIRSLPGLSYAASPMGGLTTNSSLLRLFVADDKHSIQGPGIDAGCCC